MSAATRPARAFHSAYAGRRRGVKRRLHIMREDGKWSGQQGMCGTAAYATRETSIVLLDPMPQVPPDGYEWCPSCIGHLAERRGQLATVAGLLYANEYEYRAAAQVAERAGEQ